MKWIQCNSCEKWRKIARSVGFPKERVWYCKFNTWDTRYNTCRVPEEYWDKTKRYTYIPYVVAQNKCVTNSVTNVSNKKSHISTPAKSMRSNTATSVYNLRPRPIPISETTCKNKTKTEIETGLGCVYLVQVAGYRSNVYKIGFSRKNTMERTNTYGKESTRVFSKIPCTNPLFVEQKIIAAFRKEMTQVRGKREVFEDQKKNENHVVRLFDTIAVKNISLRNRT